MQEYGPIYKSFGGSRPFVFVESPELVRQVLLTNTYRPVFPSIWLGKEREFDKANILVGFTMYTSVPLSSLSPCYINNVTSTTLYRCALKDATTVATRLWACRQSEGRSTGACGAHGPPCSSQVTHYSSRAPAVSTSAAVVCRYGV